MLLMLMNYCSDISCLLQVFISVADKSFCSSRILLGRYLNPNETVIAKFPNIKKCCFYLDDK